MLQTTDIETKQKPSVVDKQEVLQQALQSPQQTLRQLCNKSLFNFIQVFWDVVSNDEFRPNWHIELLCNELEQIAERVHRREPKQYDLIINIPPGTTKTMTCSIMFPVWCWTKWHYMKFITASYSASLALESAEYSRDIIRS